MSILGGVLEQPLTQDEKRFYGQIFKTLDPSFSGSISGITARPLLEASGLPLQTLGEIWLLADPSNTGSLDQFKFCVVMRLIAHVQNGAPLNLNLANKISPQLARFSTISPPATAPISSVSTGQSQPTPQAQVQVPPLPPTSVQSFSVMFDRSTATGKMSGNQAKSIFMNSKLPVNILEQVWNLVDSTGSGELTKPQFIVAMHLLQSLLNKSLATPPQVVPAYIWQVAEQAGGSSGQASPLVRNNTAELPPVSRPPPNQRISSEASQASGSSVVLHTPPVTSDAWTITPQQKQSFDSIFDNLDKSKQGSITGGEVANFLMTSKLPNDVLATIWELSNLDGSDVFNKSEFAIAMFLVQKKVAGFELPDETPASLISSVADMTPSYQQAAPISRAGTGAISSAVPVAVPVAAPVAPQKPKSAYDDLADLFSTPSSPAPTPSQAPIVPPVPAPRQQLTSAVTGTRAAFVPSSSFGQNMVHEQQQQQAPKEQSLLLDSDDDDDEGPEDPTAPKFKGAPPAIPGRDHKPVFDSTDNSALNTPMGTGSGTAPNYDALKSFSSQPSASSAQPQVAAQPVPQPAVQQQQFSAPVSPVQFSSQPVSANLGEFSSQPTGNSGSGFDNSAREVTNKLSQANVDIANFSNQINSLTVQTTNVNAKRDKAQAELNKILKVKETIQQRLTQLRALYEREIQQVSEVEEVLASSTQETDKLKQELALSEASYHAEQTKLQQLQLQFEESQKENQAMKEKLGVLNAESIDLKDRINDTNNKLKQSQNMLSVTTQQVAIIQSDNNDLLSRIEAVKAQISEVANNHQLLLSKQAELENQNSNLHDDFGSLSAEYSEKSLDYSNALATGAAILGAAGLGALVESKVTASESTPAEPLEEGEVPTASLDDFDDFTSTNTAAAEVAPTGLSKDIEEKEPVVSSAMTTEESTGSLTNTVVDSSTKDSTITSGSSAPTSEYQYSQTQTQSFPLPFARPESATSSVQNNPPQSVRGDFDSIPVSPTSTIEEESRGLSVATEEEVLSSQILPEGQSEETGEGEKPQVSSTSESFEIVSPTDAQEYESVSKEPEAAAPAPAEEEIATEYSEPITETATGTSEAEAEAEAEVETGVETAVEPGIEEPETVISPSEEVEESKETVDPEPVLEEAAFEIEPVENVAIPGSFVSEPEVDVSPAAVEEETITESKEVEPAVTEEAVPVDTANSAVEETTSSAPAIDQDFPPIQDLNIAEDSSDDDEFHDTLQPADKEEDFDLQPAVDEDPAPAVAATGTAQGLPSTNPFSFDLTPAAVEPSDGFDDLTPAAPTTDAFGGFSSTKNINMFDDLGLEEAAADTSDAFGAPAAGAFSGFSGFSNSAPANDFGGLTTAANADESATAEDWEHVFAGFGNDPNLQEATATTNMADSSFDAIDHSVSFSNTGFSSAPAPAPAPASNLFSSSVASGYTQAQELAIEEIEGMGFSRDDAINALQKNDWSIDQSTNYLLDSA